ncbi:carbohydrate ABC transporter permease [Arthrobacter tumbae]|uniref:carbohydrate ABC transporter permease n=1 Tax=Arthrobacter tumbae TaxID=163874 RepID=UPI001956B2A8|nr:carbohydrate ABC transporter permease [Arthrobacter tumbae]MBM7781754.1 multiple sugar transport system permease protein [Arthrobacter tumbae]
MTGVATVRKPKGSTRHRIENRAIPILRWTLIVLTVLACAGPLLYGVLLSVRPLTQVINEPLAIFPPLSELDFSSYATALKDESQGGFGLARFMGNTLYVAIGTVILAILCSVLGAYAAVRLRFFGRDTVNGMFLGVYLFPGIVLAVPLFVVFSRIGLRGELIGLVLIYLAQTVPVALYMLRNYFLAVPESIEEAAMIDGCSRLQVIRRIVLPTAMPGIISTGLYVFMIAWNEFLYALLFLADDRDRWTVSLGVAQLSDFAVPATVLMAGSIAMTIPIVIVFIMAQRLLLTGLTAGAEK